MTDNPQQQLRDLQPKHDFFIGFDSDGCVFDSMELKHKECFCPNFIKSFDLQVISKYAREVWDFVNLYSDTRGCNRFNALVYSFQWLAKRPEVQARNAQMPDLEPLIQWIEKETKLGEPALEKYVQSNNHPTLQKALNWSKGVNQTVRDMVYGVGPFPQVKGVLEKSATQADIIVVSQTPYEALAREWKEHGMDKYLRLIAGQECGKKAEHLALGAKGKYNNDKILMIGDAPGDRQAALDNNVLFYPINPGNEEASWERLHNQALDKFFNGSYKGKYEEDLIKDFESYLPSQPTWR